MSSTRNATAVKNPQLRAPPDAKNSQFDSLGTWDVTRRGSPMCVRWSACLKLAPSLSWSYRTSPFFGLCFVIFCISISRYLQTFKQFMSEILYFLSNTWSYRPGQCSGIVFAVDVLFVCRLRRRRSSTLCLNFILFSLILGAVGQGMFRNRICNRCPLCLWVKENQNRKSSRSRFEFLTVARVGVVG